MGSEAGVGINKIASKLGIGVSMKNIVGALIVAAVIIISVAMWSYFTK
jgi:hypothetical protein